MTAEQWTLVKSICFRAFEIEAERRDSWISEQTQLPIAVVEEVRRLIQSADGVSLTPLQPGGPVAAPEPDSNAWLVGTTLLDRFEVVKHLGSGSMGDVYSAFDRELDESVALKVVRPHLAEQTVLLEGLRREVQLARRVRHSNVCRLLEFHQDQVENGRRTIFYTMDLLEGETLAARLARGVLNPAEALHLARGLADGLDAIHSAGLVHRDLKPANIFLVNDGTGLARPIITDFGLCFEENRPVTETLTVFGANAVVGTPAYMAPEQLLGKGAMRQSDVYAFGVILFEMVTGRRPFEGETPLAICLRRLQEKAPSPRMYRRDVPWRWEQLILACLEREAAARPSSAPEVVVSLASRAALMKRVLSRREVGAAAMAALGVAGVVGYVNTRKSPHVPDPQAEYHLKLGIEYSRQNTLETMRSAVSEAKEAVRIDPQYAEAWANLADFYCMASTYSAIPTREARPLAQEAALRAISLDVSLGKAHAAYAYSLAVDLTHWRRAEENFRRAITLSPKEPSVRSWYAGYLGRAGKFDEAVAMAASALQLDPGSYRLNYRYCTELQRARRFEEGLAQAQKIVQIHPAEGAGYCLLARSYEWLRRFDEAEAALRHADELPDKLVSRSVWGTLFAAKGLIAKAQKITEDKRAEWLKQSAETNEYLTALGSLAMALGPASQSEAIVGALNEGIRREDETVLAAATNPYLQVCKSDPAIKAVLKRLDMGN